MKANKVVLGVLGGLAAGALLGVLLAPDKGSKTRQRILKKGKDYAGDAKEKMDNLAGVVNKSYKNLWQEGKNLINDSKEKLDHLKNKEVEDLHL